MACRKETKEIEDDKQVKFFVYVIAIIIIFIVALLSVRYLDSKGFFSKEPEIQSYSYNGFVFTNMTGLWFTEIVNPVTQKQYNIPLHFGPKQLENIIIEGDVKPFKNESEIYITFNPEGSEFGYIALAASEISINLAQTLDITPIAACTTNSSVCVERPIISCSSPGEPAVFLKQENETRIFVENNCIIVQGQGPEIVRAADRLLLNWFSVMS